MYSVVPMPRAAPSAVRSAGAGGAAPGAVGTQPAIDEAPHTEAARQRALLLFVAEWLQRAVVVARADHHKRFAVGVEGVQIEQHIMACQQRA
jgi:hypothetical protein